MGWPPLGESRPALGDQDRTACLSEVVATSREMLNQQHYDQGQSCSAEGKCGLQKQRLRHRPGFFHGILLLLSGKRSMVSYGGSWSVTMNIFTKCIFKSSYFRSGDFWRNHALLRCRARLATTASFHIRVRRAAIKRCSGRASPPSRAHRRTRILVLGRRGDAPVEPWRSWRSRTISIRTNRPLPQSELAFGPPPSRELAAFM